MFSYGFPMVSYEKRMIQTRGSSMDGHRPPIHPRVRELETLPESTVTPMVASWKRQYLQRCDPWNGTAIYIYMLILHIYIYI